MKTNLRVEQRFIVHHSCHLLYHKMTGKPVRIFMNTSLLTYAYTWQTFCTLRNGNILTYQTAHTHTHKHKVLLIPADKCPALMSGYHPISQWPWAEWNMIGCQTESEIW